MGFSRWNGPIPGAAQRFIVEVFVGGRGSGAGPVPHDLRVVVRRAVRLSAGLRVSASDRQHTRRDARHDHRSDARQRTILRPRRPQRFGSHGYGRHSLSRLQLTYHLK